ncbi:polyisoprenoid-binding protein [Emticicia sp. CRIBPO]|jgi:polyisoprenoid-binding protein YceI|uniref:YceI family protein n=1 Tax=Emticicia sp. CRIBPO TaxID=2683258 RepID=UPI0014127ED8|nr:YceI family protein [Emticicia sp. CRIBPO]NBA87114.1 polyisoprenoid-binding protein [Emticicia sp. CRIBPO]
MKKTILLALGLFTSVATFAQNWTLDKAHSKLSFTVTHLMISEVDGGFKNFDAKITSSKADLSDAVFELTAQVNSISTDNERRDGHLKSPDFFDAEKFPTLTFKSTSFTKVEGKKYKLAGNLTLHGVTKPVTLDVVLNGPVENARSKKPMVGLKVSGTINRIAFGVGTSGPSVSDDVELRAAGEFTKD